MTWASWYLKSSAAKYQGSSHYNDVIISAMASQVTSVLNAYSPICSDRDQRKLQSSAPLAFIRGIHQWPVDSSHKWPVTRKIFPFNDVIMITGLFGGVLSQMVNNAKSVSMSWRRCGWKINSTRIILIWMIKCCKGLHQKSAQYLAHWGRPEIGSILQTTFSGTFAWMKIYEFRLAFHWILSI